MQGKVGQWQLVALVASSQAELGLCASRHIVCVPIGSVSSSREHGAAKNNRTFSGGGVSGPRLLPQQEPLIPCQSLFLLLGVTVGSIP